MPRSSIFKTSGGKKSVISINPPINQFLWVDATDSSTILNASNNPASDGQLVALWKDKSGNQRDFQGIGTNNNPEFLSASSSQGGRPCIHLHANAKYNDANAKFLKNIKSSDFNNIQGPFSVFAVLKTINISNGINLLSMSSDNTLRRRLAIATYQNIIGISNGPGDGYDGRCTTPNNTNNYNIFGWIAVSDTEINCYADGTKITNSANFILTGTTPASLFMGKSAFIENSNYNAEATLDAEVTEVILYDRALNNSEINQIQTYFNTKYNLNGGGSGGGGTIVVSTPARIITKGYIPPTLPTSPIITDGLTNWLDVSNPSSYSGSGNTINDLSTNQNNASLINGASYSSDANGSINLNGSNQYIITSNLNSSGQYTSTSESIFAWVYPTAAGQIITELGSTSLTSVWYDSNIEIHSDGRMYFSTWHFSLANRVVSDPKAFNQWYLVGFTYNGTTLTAYINGQAIGTTTFSRNAPYNNGYGLYYGLGAASNTNMGVNAFLNGKIGAFYSYNKALTPSEVAQNFDATKSRYLGGGSSSSLLNNLKAFWKLDNNQWLDSSGNAYTLTNSGGVTNDAGIINNGANFSNYLQSLGNNSINLTNDFSLSFWLNSTSVGNLLSQWSGIWTIHGTNPNLINGQIAFYTYYSGDITFNAPLDGSWHFYTVVKSGSTVSVYSDGNLDNYANVQNLSTNASFKIGRNNNGDDGFIGKIDEVGIWNRALTQNEITQLYNNGQGLSHPFNIPLYIPPKFKIITKGYIKPTSTSTFVTDGLILLLDATDPASYPGTGATWIDTSGNNNNFNINPAAWNPAGYMDFKGSYGCAKSPSDINLSGDVTYLCVTRIRNSTGNWRTLTRSYFNDHHVIVQNGGWNIGMYDNDSGQFINSGYSQQSLPGYTSNSFDVMCWRWTNNDNPTYALNVDGVNVASITNSNARYNRGFGALGAFSLNTNPNSADQYWGDIKLFAVYNRRLTDEEVTKNYNAMVVKFGL